MKRALWIVLFAVVALTIGCREQPGDDYVKLTGNFFVFNYRIAEASYVVNLVKLKPTPEGSRVIGRFDNPAGGPHIFIERKVWTNNEKITLESDALKCVLKDTPYAFDIELLAADGEVLQKVSGVITSTLDQSVLPDKPLVIGPGYDKNPELNSDQSLKVPSLDQVNCPTKI